MGVLYPVTPLHQYVESISSELLDSFGFMPPANAPASRNPTEAEIRTVLKSLFGFQVSHRTDEYEYVADITGNEDSNTPDWTTARFTKPWNNEPPKLVFEKGSEKLILTIVEHLSRICGPLVLENDIDFTPILVVPGIDIDVALREW